MISFVENVGGPELASCRERLFRFQQLLLERREEVAPFLESTKEKSFSVLGSADYAFERAVLDLPVDFLNTNNVYSDSELEMEFGCSRIPERENTAQELATFLENYSLAGFYSDSSMPAQFPFFYQIAAELGGEGIKHDHLQQLLRHSHDLTNILPQKQPVNFSDELNRGVLGWLATEAKNMLLIYGEFDPWSAATPSALRKTPITTSIPPHARTMAAPSSFFPRPETGSGSRSGKLVRQASCARAVLLIH